MRTVDAVLFDKTGTLTKGAHTVTGIAAGDGFTEDEVLHLAGAVKADSEHPLARALTAVAYAQGLHTTTTGFRSLTGRGVQAVVDDRTYAVGGPALLRELGTTVPNDLVEAAQRWSEQGAVVLQLKPLDESGSPEAIGAFALEDEIWPEARQAIEQLRCQGVEKIVMITGDARAVAEAVAADLGFGPGVDEVFAEVLPADKDRAAAERRRVV